MKKFSKISPKRVRKLLRSLSENVSFLQKSLQNELRSNNILCDAYYSLQAYCRKLSITIYVFSGLIIVQSFIIFALWLGK